MLFVVWQNLIAVLDFLFLNHHEFWIINFVWATIVCFNDCNKSLRPSPTKRRSQDWSDGCSFITSSAWRSKIRRKAKTWWWITYHVSTFQVWETLVTYFLRSISLTFRVTPPSLRTSSTSLWLNQSRSIGIDIKKISSSMNSSKTFGKKHSYSILNMARSFGDASQRRSKETF